MAWRFKASKYKNATPIVPKPEACIRDICVGSYQTYGNNIAASAAFMAFNVDHNGSSLAVLPLEDCGRKSKTMPLLHAHGDTVTDIDFSPFHDGLLATGSQDCLVKLWHIPEIGLEESLCNPECTFSHCQRRVEVVRWHPCAEHLLTTVSYTNLSLWDVISQKELFSNVEHKEVIQSLSWKQDGTLLATTCKDKRVRIVDPRAANNIVQSTCSHQSIKDSRIVWLGFGEKFLTTGFNSARLRQVYIRDLRNLNEPMKTLELDCSTGILMPLFDPDTNMLFLAGKGDTTINYMEIIDRDPYLVEGIRHSGEQTKGVCMVPKRALNVMQAEINRVLQLTSTMVIPIMYQIPRKTYRDFHADIYPDTVGYITKNTATAWIQGHDIPVPKISLDPSKRTKDEPMMVQKGNLTILKNNQQCMKLEIRQQKAIAISTPRGYSRTQSYGVTEKNDMILEEDNINKDKEEYKNSKINEMRNEKSKLQNGVQAIPPKPLPRVSRANSLSEEGIKQELKPIARPRTTPPSGLIATLVHQNVIGGYKPRLGPKPFQAKSGSQEFSFDKVFSVPQAPMNDNNGHINNDNHDRKDEINNTDKLSNYEINHNKESDIIKSDSSSVEEDVNSSDSESKSKAFSTAERRKLFEVKVKDESSENENSGNFERENSNKISIAEKRLLYETKSISIFDVNMAEKTIGSPTLIKRKDSLKIKNDIQEDEIKKIIPMLNQQNMQSCFEKQESIIAPTPKRISTVFGRVSKFRHLKGTPGHKSTYIENIRNINRQVSGECDGFHANSERVAVPLSGPGGKIAVMEVKRTGRLPDGVIPALVHGATVMDFQWNPFNNQQLAVACDDGMIRLWEIPCFGLIESTNEPKYVIEAHTDKIYLIKFHPLAADVLTSASYDMTVKIWNLEPLLFGKPVKSRIILYGHTDQIFSLAWSPCGQYIATACKAGKLRIYKPRSIDSPIKEGKGPVGTRGARVVWALDGRYLVVLGFDKVSERQILVFKSDNLIAPLNTVGLDVSPAILMPYYDEDSSTLFLTGRGDSTIYAFEVTEETPFCCPLSHHRCASLHQGLSFLPKNKCDVASVEFALALRLTNNTIETLSFTVPRIKSELFQDDLFPPTKITWKSALSSREWFDGINKQAQRVSLKPPGMNNLTENQGQIAMTASVSAKQNLKNFSVSQPCTRLSEYHPDIKVKQLDIKKKLNMLVGNVITCPIEQDYVEGVEDHEWDD